MYTKNQLLEVEITDITNEGEGVGKIDGYTFFIKDAMIGDTVRFIVTKVKKNYGYGKVMEILKRSPFRIEAPCIQAKRCGGCQIQEMAYDSQLEFKRNKVLNNLVRLGGFDRDRIERIMEPVIGMDGEPFRYRNKAQFPTGYNKEGELIAGFYAGRTHAIIPVSDCLLGCEENKDILGIILDWMKQYDISAYDETSNKGVVRHVLIRKGFTSNEIMVCIVVNSNRLPYQNELINMLGSYEGLKSISYRVNKDDTNVILGDNYHTIFGSDTITDSIGDLKFKISPLSFYQVNPMQTKKLYEKALSYADLNGEETVWDLYCGIGTISLFLAQKAKQVYGVEIIPQAIEDAKSNAKLNNFTNTEFFVGKAEEVTDRIWNEYGDKKDDEKAYEMTHPDVIVVDPPRKGCDELCINTMLKMDPKRIVYVSCDSATLARDLKLLCEGGYELISVCPCDMFPNTIHVETVVLLSQQEPDEHVRIKIDLDELDETSAETKATYEKIKAWVQDKYGFKVSTLDIAKVKRLNGIIERENYNKPKSENSVKRSVTPEKEKAITEALKHFNMI